MKDYSSDITTFEGSQQKTMFNFLDLEQEIQSSHSIINLKTQQQKEDQVLMEIRIQEKV